MTLSKQQMALATIAEQIKIDVVTATQPEENIKHLKQVSRTFISKYTS